MGWILNAVFHSLICFFVPFLIYFVGGSFIPNLGHNIDHDVLSNTVYTSVIIVVSLKVHQNSTSFTNARRYW
jgi:magnesium-transporting ATPase (P-type)